MYHCREIYHSNNLAWIYDLNENEGSRDTFIYSFIIKVVSKCNLNTYGAFDLLIGTDTGHTALDND